MTFEDILPDLKQGKTIHRRTFLPHNRIRYDTYTRAFLTKNTLTGEEGIHLALGVALIMAEDWEIVA